MALRIRGFDDPEEQRREQAAPQERGDGREGQGSNAARERLRARVVGAVTVQRTDFTLPDGQTSGISVPCPAGTRAIGGGSSITPTTSDGHPTSSRPDRTGATPAGGESFTGWRVTYRNPTGGTGTPTVQAFAICAED